MKRNSMKKWLSFALCTVLIAAMALCMIGCNDKGVENTAGTQATQAQNTTQPTGQTEAPEENVRGEGATAFTLTVVDLDGTEVSYQIRTDCKTVGDALLELELIEGEQGQYGLYIQAVNGIAYDYATDGAYWGFYIDGEYALTGVDGTDIVAGSTYTLKAEKA